MLTYPEKPRVVNIDLGPITRYGYRSKMSPHNHCVPLAESQRYIINPTNPSGALYDCIKHWVHVGRRPADNTEHLSSGRLMFQGFAQFCVALLKLFEQPHILDSDYRLGGERFKEFDLLV